MSGSSLSRGRLAGREAWLRKNLKVPGNGSLHSSRLSFIGFQLHRKKHLARFLLDHNADVQSGTREESLIDTVKNPRASLVGRNGLLENP